MSRGLSGFLAVVATAAALLATGLTASASAGEWVQVSCENPNGSAAPNQGWTSSSASVGAGSNADTNCGPGAPMTAYLSAETPDPVGASELLTYTPPAGSTLAGGVIDVSGSAAGGGYNASGTSVVYSPHMVYDGSNVVYQCAEGLTTCQNGNFGYATELALPNNAGGDLFLQAGCGGAAGYTCNSNAQNGVWSQISLAWADLLLSNSSVPAGTNFGGTLLQANAHGTASLLLDAEDPDGPGVYNVTATVDGATVYSGTPSTNGGTCVPVGTYPGTPWMEFDSAQPCPQTVNVDVPINTAGLADGSHELKVSVSDAAGNAATVLDQYVTIHNTVATPLPKTKRGIRQVRVRFVMAARWTGNHTRLLSLTSAKLPRKAHLSVAISGPHHPRIKKPTRVSAAGAKALLKKLTRVTFTAGDKIILTVTVPGKRRERIELTIRNGKVPKATLL